MSQDSAISWTDDTFNPWWGCARVSPACVHCYADTWAKRTGRSDLWRRHGERRFFGEKHWQDPFRYQERAKREGRVRFVFCASMADVFEDHPALPPERERLWSVIDRTPWLTWLLLTKRPENFAAMLPWTDDPWRNVWLGVSAETQRWTDARLPILTATPAFRRFVSAEPLLGPVHLPSVDWVIVGGESGKRYRPMHPDWARGLRNECTETGTAFHFKQWGGVTPKAGGRELDGRTWDERPEPWTPKARSLVEVSQ